MEGSYWLRLGSVVLLALGAIYVLLPTILAEPDLAVDGPAATQQVEPPLQAWFTTADGDPDEATVEAVKARLEAAGVAVTGVGVRDDNLVVFLPTGARKADIEAALADAPPPALYDATAYGIDPSKLAGVDDVEELLDGAVASGERAADATPLDVGELAVLGATPDDAAIALGTAPASEIVVLALGDRAIGWARIADGAIPLHLVGDDPEGDLAKAQLGGPLPEPLIRVVSEAPVDAPVADAPVEEEEVVTGWRSMLPPTKLSLGLDLQGGIDLTLQVDQDAAVVASLNRDRRQLRDQAAEDDLTLDVRRDRSQYALEISSPMPYAELSTWVNGKLRGEYQPGTSVEREDGTWHQWVLNDRRVTEIQEQAVEQNLETLRKRVDATGVKEPAIVKLGGGRINIQLPGVSGAQAATQAIGTQATLEFRMVDEEADQNAVARAVRQAEKELPPDQFADTELLNEWLRSQGLLPEGRIVMWEYEEVAPGKREPVAPLQLKEDVVLTGGDVDNAGVGFDQNNFPRVMLDFKPRGSTVFCEVTTDNVGKRFAIILDGEIRSAPNIRERICGGRASIEMGSSASAIDDANTLALVLRSGALTAPVDIGEVREIGASLGADAIEAGVWGAGIGGLITILFMALWYGRAGVLADIALILNVTLVFALLAVIGATLTLPGIAGVALTIGMAVDANIIIFERIREELKLGVNARKAVETGYEVGLSAIVDANVTTAIAGVVLYSFGTGPIKGFAVTLLIGIVTTLVTALFVTRTFLQIETRRSDARLRL